MSSKLHSAPYYVFQGTAVSSTITSQVTNILYRDNLSYEVSWLNGSGAPAGVFEVQVQNFPADPWITLDFGSPISLSGNSGELGISVTEMSFAAIQVVYVPSSGAVDLNISVVTKKIGG